MTSQGDMRERVEAALARAEAATPGPWHQASAGHSRSVRTDHDTWIAGTGDVVNDWDGQPNPKPEPNAAFIAAAREDVPDFARALLEEQALSKALYEALTLLHTRNNEPAYHRSQKCRWCEVVLAYEQAHPEARP